MLFENRLAPQPTRSFYCTTRSKELCDGEKNGVAIFELVAALGRAAWLSGLDAGHKLCKTNYARPSGE